ncbi:MAG: hypothetical protein IPP68_12405 [Elusimicrobia bacterium]|nr:hypothetical protein [Elusimicrobiota bacterium]
MAQQRHRSRRAAGPDAGSITLTGTTYNQNQLSLNAGAATNAVQVAGGAAAA